MRGRIRNTLPADLRKKDLQEAFKMPPPPDYLASKHTYSSMKKMVSQKSNKQFIFDDTDAKRKRLEESQKIINKQYSRIRQSQS